jgi:4'-phosphopantetheinyl transferase
VPAVDIRIACLDVDPAAAARLERHLAPDELARAGRFRFARDRRHFVVARGLLREWLAERLAERPERLEFTCGEWGKPALLGQPCHFNVSHSGDRLMVALSDVDVGCDIEWIDDDLDWQPIADEMLDPRDVERLRRLDPADARAGFYRHWTRLEARLKAIGRGLAGPDPAIACGKSVDLDAWHLVDLAAAPGYAAALVAARDAAPLRLSLNPIGNACR